MGAHFSHFFHPSHPFNRATNELRSARTMPFKRSDGSWVRRSRRRTTVKPYWEGIRKHRSNWTSNICGIARLIMVDFVLSRFYPIKWVNSPRFWCSFLHLRLHFGLWLPKKVRIFWLRPFKCKLMMKLSCVFSVFFPDFPSSNTTSNRENYPFFMPGVVRFHPQIWWRSANLK